MLKIITKRENFKGYIVGDKLHYRGIAFEEFRLNNFLTDKKIKELKKEFRDANGISKEFVRKVKSLIKETKMFKDIKEDGYHHAIYLNFNWDCIDCFISR